MWLGKKSGSASEAAWLIELSDHHVREVDMNVDVLAALVSREREVFALLASGQ